MEKKPNKKEQLSLVNNVLKLSTKLLKVRCCAWMVGFYGSRELWQCHMALPFPWLWECSQRGFSVLLQLGQGREQHKASVGNQCLVMSSGLTERRGWDEGNWGEHSISCLLQTHFPSAALMLELTASSRERFGKE